jgi:hypothetical protein
MLPLASSSAPSDLTELARALDDGLRGRGLIPRKVAATGGVWPRMERLTVDLGGAEASRATRLPTANRTGGPRLQADVVEVVATPVHFEGTPVNVRLHLEDATAEIGQDSEGAFVLTPVQAARGELAMDVSRAALEAGLHTAIAALASQKGADIKSTRLEFDAPTPRRLNFRLSVTAKVFIMTTTVNVHGRIDLDDQLNARISELKAEGEGMMAGMIEGALRPQFARLEQKPIALGALIAAGLRVSDLAVSCDDSLRLRATVVSA